jgi:hypothetical protein
MDNKLLHKQVFNKEKDYVPLTVNVSGDTNAIWYSTYDAMIEPNKAIQNAKNTYLNTLKVQSDIVPIVESNFLECLVPSIFGALPRLAPGGAIDVLPIYNDIYETENIKIDSIFNSVMEDAIRHITYLKENAPEYLYVSPSRVMSPLDYAVVLRGGDFYMELITEPELSISFMEKILDVTIKTVKEFKKIINQPINECATPRGLIFPGIRLTGDAVVNMSPTMIEEVMCPLYKKFENEFGSVMLHYCCLPAPSMHVLPALTKGGGVTCVDNWQGYKTLLKEENYTQTDIGICTDVSMEQILSGELKDDEFFNTKGRPLTASVSVATVDKGIETYERWRELLL